jgi:hypothetical protein
MRAIRGMAFGSCLAILVAACGDRDRGSPAGSALEPSEEEIGGAELSLYGIGQIQRTIPHPCQGPEYREFDFWVGKWNVFGAAGGQIATSVISSELDGCLVMEDYIQNNGFQGRSMSVFDRRTGLWYQTFVDNVVGQSFRLSGGLRGEEMVMSGSQPIFSFATGTVLQRDVTVTWSPLPEERVRQLFVASFDGGPPATTFNGLYVPEPNLVRATPSGFGLCKGPIQEFLQADFWVGSWQVAGEPGPELGTSEVRKDLEDCLIEENFETAKGFKSRSFLYFDFVVEKWFRSYADNAGEHVELSGVLEGEALVLRGEQVAPSGRKVDLRVTLGPSGAGRVRQTFEVSHDGGVSWKEDLTLAYTRD